MKKVLVKTLCVCVFVFVFCVSLFAQSNEKNRPVVRGGFDVDVLIDGRSCENLYGRGTRFVEAIEGAEYELRIRNPLGIRVAVALFVDGLNTVDAKRISAEKAVKWVIEPYGTLTVSGWQVSDSRARRFYFTTERDSYATRIGQPADFGFITAVFFREKRDYVIQPKPRVYKDDDVSVEDKGKKSSSAESSNNKAGGAADSRPCCPSPEKDAATGIGRDIQNGVEWIDMKLEERSTAAVTIRYEYRNALVRMGVIQNNQGVVKKRESANDSRYAPEPR